MKIYLASTAPGHEGTQDKPSLSLISRRLLSYHHLIAKMFSTHIVFKSLIGDPIENKPKKVH